MNFRIALFGIACAFATACAHTTHDVAQIQRTQYAIDEGTASVLVREALATYPIVERGESDRLETGWVHGRDGSAYKLCAHIDGPGSGPFMVRVDATLRTKSGAVVEHDIPAWLADERDRVTVAIYERMKPMAVAAPAAPETIAAQ